MLKAKYCPWVDRDTASCIQEKKQKKRDLDLWPMTLKFNRVLEVAEVHVCVTCPQAKCSVFWVSNSVLYFGQLETL